MLVQSTNTNHFIPGLNSTTFKSELPELFKKIGNFVQTHILKPCAIGVGVGVLDFTVSVILASVVSAVESLAKVGADPVKAAEYAAMIGANFWQVAVLIPVIEEIIFRVIIQGTIEFVAEKVFGDREVEIFSHKIKLAALISIVATSVLFGLAHLSSGMGIAQVVVTTVSGLVFGILRHKYNPLASMAAHITNNTIVMIILRCMAR